MKRRSKSLNLKISGLIIGTIALVILMVWVANNLLLQNVYLEYKTSNMQSAFDTINEACTDSRLYEEDYTYELEKICANENLSVMVISSDGTVLITSQNENTAMFGQFFDVMFESSADSSDTIEANDSYTISRRMDERTQSEFLTLWGTLSDGNLILIRSAVQSMTEAAALSNELLLYIAIASLLVGIILAIVVSIVIGRLENDIRIRDENERMRREFISNVSHELKTPLALIKGYAEGLEDGVCDDTESRAFYLDVIIDETDKMSRMVSQLLSLNRLEYGMPEKSVEEFDISSVIESVVSAHRIMIEQNDIRITVNPDRPVMVRSNSQMCEQVIDNYLSNAIHYVDENKSIDISLETIKGKIRLHVFNTGQPIEDEKRTLVWEKFYKVDEARTREYGGSGIGLSIVKAISEALGNDCGVDNYVNGVDFWFDFDKIS